MNALIEKLLQPITVEQPCGPDLANDPKDQTFAELETILKGKPEVEMGTVKRPAEPPNWTNLRTKSAEFLGKSKDLRVAVMLCGSLIRTEGLAGFRDGAELIRGLLERYWPTVYPLLDPTAKDDPTQRLNTLGALTAPRGSVFGSWLMIVDYLYSSPIFQQKGTPPVTIEDLQAAKRKDPAAKGPGVGAPDLAKLEAIIRGAGIEQLAVQRQALQQSLEAVQGIDHFLTHTLGHSNTISFEVLEGALREISSVLQPYLSPEGAAGGAESQTPGAESAATDSGGIPVRGSIRSRDHVVQALEAICEYYHQVEPSSPVPYLLRRAQKLAAMDFVQAMLELKLATPESLRPSMGSAVDNATGTKPSG